MSVHQLIAEARRACNEDNTPRALLRIISAVEVEVDHRLAFEHAMLEYLRSAPSNPFAASAKLQEFIESDERSEA